MKMLLWLKNSLLGVVLVITSLSIHAKVGESETIILHKEWLEDAAAAIKAGDAARKFALARVVEMGNKAMKKGPFSVVDKDVVPESGDKHDYMSIGPYWWPDPSKKDGLPWINRDGEINPASRSPGSNKRALNSMFAAVDALANAYYFTKEEKYAQRATLLIDTWFNKPDTRMNPNLKYGQAIPGRTKGRGIGLIEARLLIRLLDGAILLKGSKAYTAQVEQGLKSWVKEFLNWMLTHENGKEACTEKNNHGTYCEAQVAVYALFTDQPKLAKKWVKRAKQNRILEQIEATGEQPHETKRTRPYHYSIFNLEAFYILARVGEHVGVDMWHHREKNGASIQQALDYLMIAVEGGDAWDGRVEKKAMIGRTFYFLQKAKEVYNDKRYDDLMLKVANIAKGEKRSELTQCLLLAPTPAKLDITTLKAIDPKGNKSRYRCYF